MKKLTITVAGNVNFNPEIVIDNQMLKFKKMKNRHRVYEIETEKDDIDIEMFKWFELEGDKSLFFFVLYFIVSFFGIFDIHEDRKPYSLKYKGKIKLNEDINELKIILNPFKPGEESFVWEGNAVIDYNDTSKYFIDEDVNAKRKKLNKIKKIIRWCGLLAFVVIVVLLII